MKKTNESTNKSREAVAVGPEAIAPEARAVAVGPEAIAPEARAVAVGPEASAPEARAAEVAPEASAPEARAVEVELSEATISRLVAAIAEALGKMMPLHARLCAADTVRTSERPDTVFRHAIKEAWIAWNEIKKQEGNK